MSTRKNYYIVVISLPLMIALLSATAQTTNSPSFAISYSITNHGKPKDQMLKGYPSAYWVVTSNSVNYALDVALSKLGLSLSPKDLKPLRVITRFQSTNSLFWTDFFELNQEMLQRFGCSLEGLGLAPNAGVRYRCQIVGSWNIDPDFDRFLQGFGQRRVKFMLAATIDNKALKSAYIPVREIYDPAPILKSLVERMETELSDCPIQQRGLAPTEFPSGFDREPSIGEPPTRKRGFW